MTNANLTRSPQLVLAGPSVVAGQTLHVSRRFVLFTVLVAINLLDVYITLLGIELGVMAEANPFMRTFVGNFWHATSVKLIALAMVAILLRAARPRWRLMETVLATAIGWYFAVLAWNLVIVLG